MQTNEKILLLRKKAGLSQEELAGKMDVSRQTVYKWESGESMPEIAKLKWIAKYFNVSLDYLIDDDCKEEVAVTLKKELPYRPIFSSGLATDTDQINYDSGILTKRHKLPKYRGYFAERKALAERTLRKFGATDIFFIQDRTTTAFFYDSKRKLCGFYFTGRIHFVCPVEKVLGFDFSSPNNIQYNSSVTRMGIGLGAINSVSFGSMPVTNTIQATSTWAILTYKTNKDEIKEYKLNFSVWDWEYVLETLKEKDHDEIIDSYNAIAMQHLVGNLQRLKLRVDAVMKEGEKVLSGETEVPDENYIDKAKALYEECKTEFYQYVARLNEETKKDNLKDTLQTIGIIGGCILICVVLISSLIKF